MITTRVQHLLSSYKLYEEAWNQRPRRSGFIDQQLEVIEKHEFIRTMAILDATQPHSDEK